VSEEGIKAVAQQALGAISVAGKTEVLEVDYDDVKFHALMRVGGGGTQKEDRAIELWWKEVITTVLYQSAGEPWELHICTEYKISKKGDLGYIWNFIFSSAEGILETLPKVSDLIAGVSETAALQRVHLDRVRVGPPDRNKASGQTRYGKPSMKGAELTMEKST